MKKAIAVFITALMLLLSMTSMVLASRPPGQLGYEGKPGNQGGGGQPHGLLGYEGQPGNQGSH